MTPFILILLSFAEVVFSTVFLYGLDYVVKKGKMQSVASVYAFICF